MEFFAFAALFMNRPHHIVHALARGVLNVARTLCTLLGKVERFNCEAEPVARADHAQLGRLELYEPLISVHGVGLPLKLALTSAS